MPLRFEISKGLNLPIRGAPLQSISDGPTVETVALVGNDYVGMRPTMAVDEGDRVKQGQLLFSDKKTPGVQYTSPAAGTVQAVNRGAKRKFESVVIRLDGDDEVKFDTFGDSNLAQVERNKVRDVLVASGLWTALRARPFSKVPEPNSVPFALFVTAIDTSPLAADPAVVLENREADFVAGLQVLSTLTDGTTYLCQAAGAKLPGADLSCVEVAEFAGPHPAGLPGTHMHMLAQVGDRRVGWYINYQDVAAIGHLMLTGSLSTDRVVSIAGPGAREPRLVRTRLGASLTEMTAHEAGPDVQQRGIRVLSGSVLTGRMCVVPRDFLGRYHSQVSLLPEGGEREFLGWMGPGMNKFSVKRAFVASWVSESTRRFPMTTSTEGSLRAIVPIGAYEQVMPLDILATPLLKALVTEDTQLAQALGCLELDEEDLALCSYVCPSKLDYGSILRRNLTLIEREG